VTEVTGDDPTSVPAVMRRYRSGDDEIDGLLAQVAAAAERPDEANLVFEMLVSAFRMGREGLDRGELKLANATMKEIRYAFGLFEPYQHRRKCSIFGSARIGPDDPTYQCAVELGAGLAAREWMVMTGAGPGIMQAGIEGAGVENSFGINIVLPFEADAASVIANDHKLINFRYFFTRKLVFMKESHGFVLLPGGFGTMDESFELLTLMQTGKHPICPVVLLDAPGETYWPRWYEFVREELLDNGLVSPADLDLVKITDSVETAVEEICGFYRRYHSMRSVGGRLVLRTHEAITDERLSDIDAEFADIRIGGRIERVEASNAELDDGDGIDLHRIGFAFDRAGYARLRHLIDAINAD
jgi:uncharacterized protein (TIGR00730 family)